MSSFASSRQQKLEYFPWFIEIAELLTQLFAWTLILLNFNTAAYKRLQKNKSINKLPLKLPK